MSVAPFRQSEPQLQWQGPDDNPPCAKSKCYLCHFLLRCISNVLWVNINLRLLEVQARTGYPKTTSSSIQREPWSWALFNFTEDEGPLQISSKLHVW